VTDILSKILKIYRFLCPTGFERSSEGMPKEVTAARKFGPPVKFACVPRRACEKNELLRRLSKKVFAYLDASQAFRTSFCLSKDRGRLSKVIAYRDVLLKPDIFKCLVAYIDADDVRGVSLLDCAISDTQYLRPRFLHMLGCGELVLNGLERHKYKYNTHT